METPWRRNTSKRINTLRQREISGMYTIGTPKRRNTSKKFNTLLNRHTFMQMGTNRHRVTHRQNYTRRHRSFSDR
jgi:hypothetical protein